MRPSCSASMVASSACTNSSSAAIWRRSAGSQAFLISARSSSRCISREIVIVVSLTFVKDDAARHGERRGQAARSDRRRRRVEEPICGSRQRWQEQIGGAARAGRLRFAMARLDELSRSHSHRMAPRKPEAGSMPASGVMIGQEEEPRLAAELVAMIRPPASGDSR
uniref:Ycg n=2 Tax=Agrobacterium tumefaciens TaxID=358 RepID=Q9JN22_AGRTU|nr:ycg [Agrobacterium tumefaciens]